MPQSVGSTPLDGVIDEPDYDYYHKSSSSGVVVLYVICTGLTRISVKIAFLSTIDSEDSTFSLVPTRKLWNWFLINAFFGASCDYSLFTHD